MLFSLYIVNRAGTLVYNRNLDDRLKKLSSNEYLRVGSTFHSLHALARQAAPVESGGILSLEASTFSLRCLSTLTGMKFMIFAAPGAPALHDVLRHIYVLYADYVLKNPFYEFGLLIKCHLFDDGISKLRDKYEASQGNSL